MKPKRLSTPPPYETVEERIVRMLDTPVKTVKDPKKMKEVLKKLCMPPDKDKK